MVCKEYYSEMLYRCYKHVTDRSRTAVRGAPDGDQQLMASITTASLFIKTSITNLVTL